jgi:hypothetical protein
MFRESKFNHERQNALDGMLEMLEMLEVEGELVVVGMPEGWALALGAFDGLSECWTLVEGELDGIPEGWALVRTLQWCHSYVNHKTSRQA